MQTIHKIIMLFNLPMFLFLGKVICFIYEGRTESHEQQFFEK